METIAAIRSLKASAKGLFSSISWVWSVAVKMASSTSANLVPQLSYMNGRDTPARRAISARVISSYPFATRSSRVVSSTPSRRVASLGRPRVRGSRLGILTI
jgi:hypothetical protein